FDVFAAVIGILLTGLVATFTVSLAISTKRLWQSTDKLWHESQSTTTKLAGIMGVMEQSIAVAKTTADAALKSTMIAEETLVSQQRPWLVIEKLDHRGGP